MCDKEEVNVPRAVKQTLYSPSYTPSNRKSAVSTSDLLKTSSPMGSSILMVIGTLFS